MRTVTKWSDYRGILADIDTGEFSHLCSRVVEYAREARSDGAKVIFVGNGASAAIASHMACDWQKNARIPALCFNDLASLTAISNDIGYDMAFAGPLRYHGRPGDLLFAISSSGNSSSIINAVNVAKEKTMTVVTLSGFSPNNPLRLLGNVNFFVPINHYGLVEVTHLAIIHHILDRVIDA